MKALKIKLYQETVCYKKPFAMKIAETYPLPPYSTVNGLLHKLLGAKSYIPLAISIQGKYESVVNNYQTTYFYKKDMITSMPMNSHVLLGVELILHITAAEEILQSLYDKFVDLDEFISLGRKEDLVRIDSVEFVEVLQYTLGGEDNEEERTLEKHDISYPIYIPNIDDQEGLEELSGIRYRLNSHYLEGGHTRMWQKVDTLYVDQGNILGEGEIYLDSTAERDLVYFHLEV